MERLLVDMEEADDFTAAAEFLLAEDPRRGMPASEDGRIWYLPMMPVRGRRVSLFYSFDETSVFFLAMLPHDD